MAANTDEISMNVCHIISPSSFYCQFSTGELLRIEELLTQNYVESQMSRAVQLSHDELLQSKDNKHSY